MPLDPSLHASNVLLAVDASEAGVWEWPDVTGERLLWSPGFYRILGYQPEELDPNMTSFLGVLHPEDLAEIQEKTTAALKTRDRFHSEYRLVRKDGTIIWVEATGRTFFDEKGAPSRMAGLIRDVTSQRQLRDRLAASEKRYRAVFETSPAGMVTVAPDDLQVLDANPAFCTLLGYTLAELRQKTVQALTHPDDWPLDEEALAYRESGPVQDLAFDKRLLHKDGSPVWIRVFSIPMNIPDQEDPVILGIVIDLTYQKDAEARSREFSQRLELVLRSSRIGMWDWKIQTGELDLDEIWAAMLGYTLEDLQPTTIDTFFDTLHPDDLGVAQEALDRHFEGLTEFYECQLRLMHKEGHLVWVLARGKVVERNVNGVPLRMLGTHSEITDVKQAELQRRDLENRIQQTQKLESLGVLAGGIAHDFNNILMVIQGHSELAQIALEKQEEAGEYLEQIQASVRQAADLCAQMLAYSGRGSFLIGEINLGTLIQEMTSLLQTSVTSKVPLEILTEGQVLPFQGDITQIRQVIMNLVINAAEAYGNEGGTVRITTQACTYSEKEIRAAFPQAHLKAGSYTVLTVQDWGCGMDEATRERLFEPFYTTKFTGRGLGMSAVQGIVRAHQGGLAFTSEAGHGTTFCLAFPTRTSPQVASSHSSKPAKEGPLPQGETVLVVDDEDLVLELTRNMLQSLGFTVLTATDGLEALEVHARHAAAIRCVLLDLTMPNLDGEETYTALRQRTQSLPVILCSGYSSKELERRFFGKGLGGYLHKPYSLDDLRRVLGKVLA